MTVTITTDTETVTGYTIVAFKGSGSTDWTVPDNVTSVEALIVGGGAGGGHAYYYCGGGGAGAADTGSGGGGGSHSGIGPNGGPGGSGVVIIKYSLTPASKSPRNIQPRMTASPGFPNLSLDGSDIGSILFGVA